MVEQENLIEQFLALRRIAVGGCRMLDESLETIQQKRG